MKMRRGVTLVEVTVAGAILVMLTVALFNGIILAGRISRNNAEILQAESVAWDAAWAVFNEDIDALKGDCDTYPSFRDRPKITLAKNVASMLSAYDTDPTLTLSLSSSNNFVIIKSDVEWGARNARRRVSDSVPITVTRGPLMRINPKLIKTKDS